MGNMKNNTKRKHSEEFKAKVVMEILRGEVSVNQAASKYSLYPGLVEKWRAQAVKNFAQVFKPDGGVSGSQIYEQEMEKLYQEIGRLQVENGYLKKKLGHGLW